MPLLLHRFEIVAEKRPIVLLHPNIQTPSKQFSNQTPPVLPTVAVQSHPLVEKGEDNSLTGTAITDQCPHHSVEQTLSPVLIIPQGQPAAVAVCKPLKLPRKKRPSTAVTRRQPETSTVSPLSLLLGSLTDIELLHWYNDIKDCAQRLLEMKAERLGISLSELYAQEGIASE